MSSGIAEAYQLGGMELALLAILSAVLAFFYKIMREYLHNQKLEREELFRRSDDIQKKADERQIKADEKAEKRENLLMDHINKSDKNYEVIANNMARISEDLNVMKTDVAELKNR
jgi:hypothetical protein